jgi:hypothetical protein
MGLEDLFRIERLARSDARDAKVLPEDIILERWDGGGVGVAGI